MSYCHSLLPRFGTLTKCSIRSLAPRVYYRSLSRPANGSQGHEQTTRRGESKSDSGKENMENSGDGIKKDENKGKSVAQSDEELKRKLEAMSGEGGAAGLELEDGKPVAMKRSVRNNMFRLI